MNRQRLNRILVTGLALGFAVLPQTASACAACFGKSDSKMAQGMNMGILSLLAVVVVMQVAVGSFFFVFLKKRAAKIAAARAASAPRASVARELSSTTHQALS